MKIGRCLNGNGEIFWAVIHTGDSTVQPLIGELKDWSSAVIAGDMASVPLEDIFLTLSDLQLLPPVERGNSVFVVGANYLKHLDEMEIEPSQRPHAFLKSWNALIGPGDPIQLPAVTQQLDHEVELVAVIGSSLVAGQDPQSCILGYTAGNEMSGRDLQPGTPGIGMDLFAAKSLYHTNPVGPWIVTIDEFESGKPDLRMTLSVNGVTHQDGRSSEMNWSPAELVDWVNIICRVEPGDIIFTGTPEGVGWKAGRFLQDGDLVETEIERIGKLTNKVVSASGRAFPG